MSTDVTARAAARQMRRRARAVTLAPMSLGWSLAAVPFLIAMNAFFVAAEYAVVAVRPAQVESMRRRGKRGTADAIARLKADPAGTIGAIQVCITMTNLLL